MPPTQPLLSTILPPLIFGTATFNYQYNDDPFSLPTTALVHRALSSGVRAFDTSPYYGPAEEILGAALSTPFPGESTPFPRNAYHLLTKVGRISAASFNYSASWVRASVQRSLARLHTTYLDVVYCHDVEFVTPAEVLEAITELRRLRDEEQCIKYIGISGYPVDVLCSLAELIVRETGEPVDVVMSYANFTVQNRRLETRGLARLRKAGVDVVPNASILGMGLLRGEGVPVGAAGNWHPAPDGLREACKEAVRWCEARGEKLEVVAIRWALERWMEVGAQMGSKGDPASGVEWKEETNEEVGGRKLGVSVMGVSNLEELEETLRVWRSILDGLEDGSRSAASLTRGAEVKELAAGVYEGLGKWKDFAWSSPDEQFVLMSMGTIA